jgi:hypothetical protein
MARYLSRLASEKTFVRSFLALIPMNLMTAPAANTATPNALAQRLRAAVELLEGVAVDRTLLSNLSLEERTRLLHAAGQLYCPDVKERRRLVKAKVRQRKLEKLQRDQSKLNETGIRKLRRQKVFTTPTFFRRRTSSRARS